MKKIIIALIVVSLFGCSGYAWTGVDPRSIKEEAKKRGGDIVIIIELPDWYTDYWNNK